MPHALLPLVASPLLLIGVWVASKWRHPVAVTTFLSAIAFVFGFATESELLQIQSVITGFCILPYRSTPSRILSAAFAAFLIGAGIYLIERGPDLAHAYRMRLANPLQSIASRLRYERGSPSGRGSQSAELSATPLSESAAARLTSRE